MSKLTSPPSRLQAPVGRLLAPSTPKERESFRAGTEPWRKWYRLKRWYDLRKRVLLRDLFTCQWFGCGRTYHDTSLLVAHHKVRHRGSATLFWDENNVMCVCKTCHDGPIKALERSQGGA